MILKALAAPALAIPLLLAAVSALPAGFTIEQILSAPFASGIVVAPNGREYVSRKRCAHRESTISELVFPDEIHGFLRHASWIRAYTATAAFLDAKLGRSSGP